MQLNNSQPPPPKKKMVEPLVKVKTSNRATLAEGFCELLIGLHTICPTIFAAIERIFSDYVFVWNKMGNF